MDGPFYMDAVITPHASLSRRGLIVLICVLAAVSVSGALVFLGLRAAPIPLFLGLDMIALVVALAASRRAARIRERVQVTAAEIRVLRETARGPQILWRSPTAFTRVILADDGEDRVVVALALRERRLAVACALTRSERRDFAQALERAIRRACDAL